MDGFFPNDPPTEFTEFTEHIYAEKTEHILLKLSGFMPGMHSPSSGPSTT